MQSKKEWLIKPGGLAERLRSLREAAGLTTQAALAERAGWDRVKVSKIENGHQAPTESDIRAWADICGVPDAAGDLLAMLADGRAEHRQWRHLHSGQAGLQADYDTVVRSAARVRNFEIMLIPGILQTPDYARYRALEAVRVHGQPEDGVDSTVAARMRRTDVLYAPGKTFEFIITEAALRYLLCPPEVMAGQLDRLMSASRLPNVKLGIIPPGVELAVAPMVGYIVADDVAYAETFTAMDTYVGPEAAKYGEIFDGLMAESVTGDGARALIAAAINDLNAG